MLPLCCLAWSLAEFLAKVLLSPTSGLESITIDAKCSRARFDMEAEVQNAGG
ncbi:uncharacterized protein MYCFIDRAFT_183963 [Pseudocercospora fijiensis CIRAD86]|uniref:Uncharacterized protein n=1 Tax=Pseudocercospora fijiensis (strain CIRAD86) TaxID=383855 RepID=M2ZHT6_PSEFD|nr:uncharacterized protein MYCFIDRAFT_183963 [Pseudocercospora fijiensis CIRAD86]EME78679.1 hypothetical protein MYCFIDRAFT_183963 [Pseudocercospora fijiensis CIRAD86]